MVTSHQRISSTDSKGRVTLQNSSKHFGSERVKSLDPFGAADNISALISNRMSTWKTELTGGGKMFG